MLTKFRQLSKVLRQIFCCHRFCTYTEWRAKAEVASGSTLAMEATGVWCQKCGKEL